MSSSESVPKSNTGGHWCAQRTYRQLSSLKHTEEHKKYSSINKGDIQTESVSSSLKTAVGLIHTCYTFLGKQGLFTKCLMSQTVKTKYNWGFVLVSL